MTKLKKNIYLKHKNLVVKPQIQIKTYTRKTDFN